MKGSTKKINNDLKQADLPIETESPLKEVEKRL
jgi:hypothetical protein